MAIEDPEEEPQVEKPEECVYYNDLTAAKDIAVTDLLSVITAREAKEHQGFTKEFKVTLTYSSSMLSFPTLRRISDQNICMLSVLMKLSNTHAPLVI